MACDGRFTNNSTGYSVIFEDDGRVAYAYLLDECGSIVCDVWMYNRCKTPVIPEWHHTGNMPFANPCAFVNTVAHDDFQVVNSISDIGVDWEEEAGKMKVSIYVRNELFAVLIEGAKPGWSLLAGRNGPLAKVLE